MKFKITVHDMAPDDQGGRIIKEYNMQVHDMNQAQIEIGRTRMEFPEYYVLADFEFFQQTYSLTWAEQTNRFKRETPFMHTDDPDDARDIYLENRERDFEDRMNAYFERRHEDL